MLFRWHVDDTGACALSEIGALTHFPEMFIWFEEGVRMNRREGLRVGPGEEERKKGLVGPVVEGCSSWQPAVGLGDIGPIWAQELTAEFAILV